MSFLANRFNNERFYRIRERQRYRLRFNMREGLYQHLSIHTDTDASSTGFRC